MLIAAMLTFFVRDLAKPGLPTMHDTNPHIARMIAYGAALKDGQFPPMWGKELMGGIGSPVMMLNYQLPYMISESFVLMGRSIFESYKLTLALSFVLSGLLMYQALKSKYGTLPAWTGALVYTLAPYRFVDIYVRGALGESLSFIFPPLLIWGFSKKSWPLLILGWAGLFLTHPTASAAFSAFFLGYLLLTLRKGELIAQLKLFGGPYVIALLVAAFNLLPTLALTRYTYYSPALSDTMLMFPTLSQLFHSPWGYGVSMPGNSDGMSFALGFVQWSIFIASLVVAYRYKNITLRYLVGACATVLFFILPVSIPLYEVFGLTKIIDFPWRLIMCVVFAAAWMGAEVVEQMSQRAREPWLSSRVKSRDPSTTVGMTVVVITILLIAQSLPIAHTDKYWDKPLTWFARETGDSYGEYAPLTRDTKDSSPFWQRAEYVRGNGTIELLSDRSNEKKFRIVSEGGGEIRINTMYFPGWEIPGNCKVTERTLSHIDDSGLIGCVVKSGEQVIEIKYKSPPVQRVGNLITLLGIGMCLWVLFRSYYPHTTNAKRSLKT